MRNNITRGSYKQRHWRGSSRRKAAPNDLIPQMAFLENRFDLTAAEARLVVHLITGASLRSCGNALGIKYETARRHLTSASLKIGTHAMNEVRRQKARWHEYYRKRRATMTPEQLDAERAYQREQQRKRRA